MNYTEGFYWVKFRGDWVVAQYFEGDYWMIPGYLSIILEDELKEIGDQLQPHAEAQGDPCKPANDSAKKRVLKGMIF